MHWVFFICTIYVDVCSITAWTHIVQYNPVHFLSFPYSGDMSTRQSLYVCLVPVERVVGEATGAPAMECCACGTAKYRLTFYGNWSEKVHPKDYPSEFTHSHIQ